MSWTNRPDRGDDTTPVQILRARPGKVYEGIILSEDVCGAYTHYWHGRTVICKQDQCDACLNGRMPRWYGYLPIWCPSSNQIVIVELTPACVPALNEFWDKYHTLRTAKLKISRVNAKQNSRVVATFETTNYNDQACPTSPDVQRALSRLWEVKTELVTPTDPTRLTILNPTTKPKVHQTNGKH